MEESTAESTESQADGSFIVVKEENLSPDRDESSSDWSSQACHIQEDPMETLSIELVIKLLKESEGLICYVQAALPKAGQSFVYDTTLLGDTWEKDHYDWVEAGREEFATDSCVVTKCTYYLKLWNCIKGCIDFQRLVYSIDSQPNIILVSYVGDEKVFKGKPSQVKKELNSTKQSRFVTKRGRGRPRKAEADAIYGETRAKAMDIAEAVDMLENYEDSLSLSVAQLPKGGEVYYYDTNVVGETWKYDGYLWRNAGKKNMPKEDPAFQKTFYSIRLDETSYDGCPVFQRIVFRAIKRPNIILVQYTGDETIWHRAMHTNHTVKPTIEISDEELANPPVPAVTSEPNHEITWQEAAEVLRNHTGRAATNRPYQPKAGDGYIFYLKAKMKEGYKHDGYNWQAQSPVYFPRDRPKMTKRTHFIKTKSEPKGSNQFQKSVYCLLENMTIALVHYHGDQRVAISPSGVKRNAEDELGNETSKQKIEEEEIEVTPTEGGIKSRSLRLQEVLDLLNNCEDSISQSRAIRPRAGEIYIFDTDIIGEDWKCDNYVWRNSGTNFQPKKNPLVRKVFYSIRLDEKVRGGSKAFQKTVYSLIERPTVVMVHYFGDETVYSALMHGNRKKGFVEYTRTVPSVMKSIKKAIVETSGSTPKNTLKHLEVAYNLDETPRNLDQIRNTKRLLAKKNVVPSSTRTYKVESDTDDKSFVNMLKYVSHAEKNKLMDTSNLFFVNAENDNQIVQFAPGTEEIDMDSLQNNEVIYIHSGEPEVEEHPESNVNQVEIVLHEASAVEQSTDPLVSNNEPENGEEVVNFEVSDQGQILEQILKPETVQNEIQETVAADSSLDQPEETNGPESVIEEAPDVTPVIDLANTSDSALRTVLSTVDNKTIVIQALDPRPEVCQTQLELLKQQQRIRALEEKKLKLEEKKLELEIKRLEEGQGGVSETSLKMEPIEAVPVMAEVSAAGDNTMPDGNVVYINHEDFNGIDPAQMGQVILIEGSADGLIEGYSEEYAEFQEQE